VDGVLGACSLEVLRQRKSFKWRTYAPDVLPAFVAEMDFDLAEQISETVTAALAIGDSGYPHQGVLGEAFRDFAADRLGWSPDPARVFAIPDVMTGLVEVVQAVTPPGSGIVINPPVYPPFSFRFGFAGRRIVTSPLARDGQGRYDLDLEALDAALAEPGVAAYVLCSPHNPTGSVWSRAQLEVIGDICQRRGVVLLVDEIHAPLVLPGARFRYWLLLRLASHPTGCRSRRPRSTRHALGLSAQFAEQQVPGDLGLPVVLRDILKDVQQRITLGTEFHIARPLGRVIGAPGRRARLGRRDISFELAFGVLGRSDQVGDRS
jgi:cysteine-S-conjugate beta-lyase